jgi:Fe(3+) dicitrate transport protein
LDQQFDGGRALIKGVEGRYGQGFQWGKVWIPVQFNLTWFQAEFQSEFESSSPEWGQGQIRKGDPLPYVPEFQYNLVVSTQYKRFSQEVSIIYQGKMYDQSAQEDRREIDPYGLVDWRGSYKFSPQGTVFVTGDNIFNKIYVSGLKPYGYRGGKPQSFGAGVSYTF